MDVKLSEYDKNHVISGIYKITFPNQKIYIGLSNNIHRRLIEHNTDFRRNTPCSFAIKKYGPIESVEVLEEIDPTDRLKLQERECFWIQYYQSNDKRYGYNVTCGGDGSDIGSKNLQAKLNEEQYWEVVDLLQNHLELSILDISSKYNMDRTSLSRLNNGYSYWHKELSYPIRTAKDTAQRHAGTKSPNSNISDKQLETIFAMLENTEYSLRDIAETTKVKIEKIREINRGFRYKQDDKQYPIRELGQGSKKLTPKQVSEIYDLITNTEDTLVSISKKYNVSAKTISNINRGTSYKRYGYEYPLRKQ